MIGTHQENGCSDDGLAILGIGDTSGDFPGHPGMTKAGQEQAANEQEASKVFAGCMICETICIVHQLSQCLFENRRPFFELCLYLDERTQLPVR